MKELSYVLNIIENIEFKKIIISNPSNKQIEFKKIIIEPKINKSNFFYQFSKYCNNKVFHENIFEQKYFIEKLREYLCLGYKQVDIKSKKEDYKILINKENKCHVTKLKKQNLDNTISYEDHNREKNYIIKEGKAIDFLVHLDVMTIEGKVKNHMQKKFKQINRFLEFIDDINEHIKENSFIVDFGSGKSYLTFAIYYYFNIINKKNVNILGLDLKKDVVDNCNLLAKKFNFNNLNFLAIDIKDYNPTNKIDMVISLHACDTATDFALFNAIKWNSDVILSVPCCQHEINNQIENKFLNPILKYGILKDRFSSILTDSIRGQLLSLLGYKVSILEFIDMEHTPKNLLIRSIKKNSFNINLENYNEIVNIINKFNINQTLFNLLDSNNYFDKFKR